MQEGAHYESEYFLTLTYLPPLEAEERMKGWMFEGGGPQSANRTAEQILDRFSSRVDVFENVFGQLFQTERLKRICRSPTTTASLTCMIASCAISGAA